MEPIIYVVDVGQGSCNIIVFGDPNGLGNRAIVIDCGPSTPKTALEILIDNHVEWIDVLVVSHNDKDHFGGVARIVSAYAERISRTLYVSDRDPKANRVFQFLKGAYKSGWVIEQPRTISIEDRATVIYPFGDGAPESVTKLLALSPQGHEAEVAKEKSDTNEVSAVLMLTCGQKCIVFPGDATMNTWLGISERRKGKEISADVLVIPHHGGHLGWPVDEVVESYTWLLSKVVHANIGLLSVGTNNQHKHPRRDVLDVLYASGMRIACTEATENCARCDMAALLERRRRSLPLRLPSFSARDSKKVPCVGTIAIDMKYSSLEFLDIQSAISALDWQRQQLTHCPIAR